MLKSNLTYKIRRKAVAHFDVQSITANLNNPVVVSQKNTITGASAASKNTCVDQGDGKSNSLVMSCPFFRNEIGTEKEVNIVLNRLTASQSQAQTDDSLIIHCPSMASGLSLLEDCSSRWSVHICPYQKMLTINTTNNSSSLSSFNNKNTDQNKCFIIENCDIGASYYRKHFYGLEHQNWFGIDDNLGPIAISIRKERISNSLPPTNNISINNNNNMNGLYSGNNSDNINNNGQINGQVNSSSSTTSSSIGSSSSSHHHNNSNSNGHHNNNNSKEVSVPNNTNASGSSSNGNRIKHQYRIIIRTSQLSVLRGTVYEDYIPALASSRHTNHNNHHAKEVLEYIAPELNLSALRLGVSNADEQLLKLDEQVITRTYKVGVLYCKAGQGTEEEMYNNEHSSPQFEEFLSCLGERVKLKGFDKYRAGLDNKTDTTGLYSIYANYSDCEIMFHVSTLLPYTPNNRQQLLRKRHIGNDIVTIVFQEPGALPFTPMNIRSHFQHVFIIVRLLPPEPGGMDGGGGGINAAGCDVDGSNNRNSNGCGITRYAVAVTRSKEVPVFGPPIPEKGVFNRGKEFTEFLLAKIINGENAAHKSEKFSSMAQRTRHGYLKDLATNYVTNTTLNDVSCGNSASAKLVSTIFGSSKRRGSHRVKDWQFIGDPFIRGAIVWEVTVNDYGQSKLVDCYVGISCDTFIIIEEATKQILFACPNSSILGWDASHSNYIEIFCHQGECIRLNCKDQGLDLDEISEIKTRLMSVTTGCQTKELILKRNNHGQLGFHIEPDGIVTNVEKFAFAWNAGLKPNCRIVKICEVVIATLNYTDMIDYLKTSSTVKITVLDPNPDGSPKRGCNLPKCPYLSFMAGGSSNNNNNNNGSIAATRDSHLSLLPPTSSLNSANHGGDYENIGIMIDPKKYQLHPASEGKNGLHHRFPYTGAPTSGTNKNCIGLPLGNYPTPFATSQSSKSLTVSPEKERENMIKLTPSSSSSNIYSNLGSSQIHFTPSSFVSGLTRFSAKREPLRPKSTTNECASLSSSATVPLINNNNSNTSNNHTKYPSGSTSITMSPPPMPKGLSKDHMVMHHLGNVMLSRSELCLASKNCCPMPNVKPTSSPTNQSMTLTNNIIVPPLSSSSTHTRSHSHHFTKIGDKFAPSSSALGIPYTHSPNPGLTRTSSVLKHPGSSSAVEALSAVSPSPSEWSNSAWSSPRITRRAFEPPPPPSSVGSGGGLIVGGGGGSLQTLPGGTNLSSANSNNTMTSYPTASSREIFVNNRGKPVLTNQQHHLSTLSSSSATTNYSNMRSNSLSDRIKIRSGSYKSSGSSCSGSSTSTSTLQEDLLKLISPDYLVQSNTGDCESNGNTSGGETSTSQYSTPYSSLERSSTKEMPCKDNDQVILTVAQPAQVIFSQPSSPTDFSKGGGNGKDGSPLSRASSILSRSQTIANLPLSRSSPSSSSTGDKMLSSLNSSSSPEEDVNIDWPTLVETATKAMANNDTNSIASSDGLSVKTDNALEQWVREFGANGNSTPNGHLSALSGRSVENLKELEETVKKLQYDLVKEQSDKAKLAELVKSLEKENSRLQEEQKTAVNQLKTLTDFFFKK